MSNNCSDFSDGIQLPCNYCMATECHQNQQSWKKLAITMTNLTFTCNNDQKATSCVDAGGIWLHYPLAPKFSVIWWLGSVIMTNNVPCDKDKQTIHSSCLTYSWFSVTWWDGHVGVQDNGKMSLKFCIIIESKSQKTFFAVVLYTNMATVTSNENRE